MGENPTAHEAAENRRSSVMCRWEEKKKKNSGGGAEVMRDT